ncbi:hypothetical protein B7494_g2393 [Chlorociboria aeruginascens]|nr:hypothetical protein B7494_g2393 [Chlorociboria aeruginascens]
MSSKERPSVAREKSSLPSIIHGPVHPPLLRNTFGQLMRQQCKKYGDNVVVISQHQNESITYSDLHSRSDILAAAMISIDIKRGDRVAVLLGNRSEYIDLLIACAKIGALITLLNYAYTPTEIFSALLVSAPKVLFTTVGSSKYDYRKPLLQIESQVPSLRKVVLLQDTTGRYKNFQSSTFFETFESLVKLGHHKVIDWTAMEKSISDTDILNLQFTSGSTGMPKMAALTHHGMINSAQYIGLNMNVVSTDKIVVPVPLFHAFGLIIGLCTAFVAGASVVLPSEYFDAGATLKAVERYKCTGLYGVTTMFLDELSHPDFSKTVRSSLRFGVMAGSALPEDLLLRVMNKFPIPDIYTNWGMTELSSIATMTVASDPISKKLKTAGKLLPNLAAKIVKPDTGTVLPWGQKGEIVVSGFGVMHSYFGDAERTSRSLKYHADDAKSDQIGCYPDESPRKWMHTGDEGYIDQEGYLVVTGRIKDLIIRGGENIAPLEIEERLFQHPAIKQACVFGIPSERYGEEVAAFLELEDGMDRPSDEAIRDWVRGTLSRYKVPVRIWWLGDALRGCPTEWPKTANGKLRKKDIKQIGTGNEGERDQQAVIPDLCEQCDGHIPKHPSACSTPKVQDVICTIPKPYHPDHKDTNLQAPQLGSYAIKSALEKSFVPISKISDVYMGNVLQASVGQAPARQASIFAGLPTTIEAVTVNKVCASGLKAIVFAAQNIQLGLAEAEIAGGMECMSQVPYYLPRANLQPNFGHQMIEDGLIKDGLWDPYNNFLMGNCAEKSAKEFNISRVEQDDYAILSYQRAQAAWRDRKFDEEIVPVVIPKKRGGDLVVSQDEGFESLQIEKLRGLRPAFSKDNTGSITAANASTMNDGASAVVLGNAAIAKEYGERSKVLARILSYADAAVDPVDFSIAPAKAVKIALERAGITKDQIAVWEFNEAFAAVVKVNQQILELDIRKINPLGGAISLGHALGNSGARILTTLLHQLKPNEYGVAAICNGGGAATAMLVQRIKSVS